MCSYVYTTFVYPVNLLYVDIQCIYLQFFSLFSFFLSCFVVTENMS